MESPADAAISDAGRCLERLFPRDSSNPQKNAATGAHLKPTDAINVFLKAIID